MEFVNADVSNPATAKQQEESTEDVETSPVRSGPPSETSSQEWDTLTDPGSQAAPSEPAELSEPSEPSEPSGPLE